MQFNKVAPKKSGLPDYVRVVVAKRPDGTLRENYYVHKGDFRVRVPHPDSKDFQSVYEEALNAMRESISLLEPWQHGDSTISKNEVHKYFAKRQSAAKRRAKAAVRDFSLPKDWAADAYIRQAGICALSGVKMRLAMGLMDPFCPTIDRINSKMGYTPENCQIIALQVNLAKNNLTETAFVQMCRSVSSHVRKRMANVS